MSDVPPVTSPPAGWYPDPIEPSVLRYWDGSQWTADMQPAPQFTPTSSGPRLTNRGAIGIVLALAAVLTLIFALFGGGGGSGEEASPENLSASQIDSLDADAQIQVRTAQTSIETFSTDNDGQYANATAESLRQIEPSLTGSLTVDAQPDAYLLTVESETGTSFSMARDPSGVVTLSCTPAGVANCPDSGDWSQ